MNGLPEPRVTPDGAAPDAIPAASEELDADALHAIGRALVDAGRAVTARLESVLCAWELSPARWQVLRRLWSTGDCSCSDLAASLHVSRSRITAVTDDLVHAGLVEREHPFGDRRIVLVRLSAAGRERVEAVLQQTTTEFGPVYGHLDSGRRAELVSTLELLTRHLSAAPQPAARRPGSPARPRHAEPARVPTALRTTASGSRT
ncbi:DNA-binding MarR family transcriptional regulator [Kineococcus xinjiangensis]|uniref:DNA-binding MarR family transcriptional regulator n=1 Tax=Kineococcus xinjiangensis TaxID=512762 RepID=A0A2S6IXG3_9ACTN|nr:MarR family transcriptional regulator [Kineococcus xinjiangensis]PPK98831.1 DNA-binding MarR family transcriptional regulator [Kineococcus xinjiangensis]